MKKQWLYMNSGQIIFIEDGINILLMPDEVNIIGDIYRIQSAGYLQKLFLSINITIFKKNISFAI